jgi:MoxR-like ATPase
MNAQASCTTLQSTITKLQAIERELSDTLIEREEVIRAALIALLARQHLVILGPPGTAKSQLVTALASRISPPNGAGLKGFTYLMTRFTTPEELFGPVSVQALKQDEYRRVTTGKLVEAELAFLDEIFKASSAILNALLKITNERLFSNGNQEISVPLISLFAASNELPQGNELEALWDRFLLRLRVGYVSDGGFAKLIRAVAIKQNGNGQAQTLLPAELADLQQSAEAISVPATAVDLIEQLRKDLNKKGIFISDRRWGQTLDVLRGHALLEGRADVTEDDLVFLKHCLWQSPEQQAEIGKRIARLGNPLHAKAVDLGDQAASVYQDGMQSHQSADDNDKKIAAAIEANGKLKAISNKLQELREQATAHGKPLDRVEKVIAQVAQMRQEFVELALY